MRSRIEILKFIFKTDVSKFVVLLSIVIGLFAGNTLISRETQGYFISLFHVYVTASFHAIVLAILLINSIHSMKIFEKLDFYIMRVRNKRNYIKSLLIITSLSNFFIITLIFVIVLCCLNMNSSFSLGIVSYELYGISNVVYLFFFLMRYIIITLILMSIHVLAFKILNRILVFIIDIYFLTSVFLYSYKVNTINTIWKMPLLPQDYYFPLQCNIFSLEIGISIIFILLLLLIYCVLARLACNKMSQVID